LRIPIVSQVEDLDQAPRKFLWFAVFNVFSWQCIVGPVLVLFARALDMPPSWVGFLISFMPLSMLLVVTTIPLVTRFGPKRLMSTAWVLRNLTMCSVFLMPCAMSHWGPRAAWYVLLGATLGFCLIRAIGASAWFPWLHEVVPEGQRAAYFSAETAIAQVVAVCVAAIQAVVLHGHPGVPRFLCVYGMGIASGLVSVVWMSRVPGGAAPTGARPERLGLTAYRVALADRSYVAFALTAALCLFCISWYTASVVLYMRDAVGMASRTIMILMATGGTGTLLTIHFWGRFAKHSGSGRAMFKTLIAHSIAALSFVLMNPGSPRILWALAPALVCATVFAAAFRLAANRAMLNYVHASHRPAYTNLWIGGTSAALSLAPILAGLVIHHWHLLGFRICFAISGGVGLCCAAACRWVVQDGAPFEPSLARMLNPVLPLRTLLRIVWVTVGLHESNR